MEDQQQLKRRSTNNNKLENGTNQNDDDNGQKPAAKKARHINNNNHNSDDDDNENPSNPVHIITIDYENDNIMDDDDHDDTPHISSSSSPPSISLTPKLEELIYPMTTQKFFSSILRKKALHVTCRSRLFADQHASKRLSSALLQNMFHLDPNKLFHETSSDNIFLWIHNNSNDDKNKEDIGNGNTNNNKFQKVDNTIRSIEISDPDQAYILHSIGGHASYCRAPPIIEQNLVSSLLKETGLGCGQYHPSGESLVPMGRGEVETFISTTRGQITNWHYDFQENFTIQLSGVKKWTIQQGKIQDPIRGCTPHYGEVPGTVESQLKAGHLFDTKFQFGFPKTGITATGKIRSVFVKPGDVFYFPAGMWHRVETIEPGVSINVSLMASNYASVTCQALQQLLYKSDKRWMEPVRNNAVHNPIEHLKTLLKDLPSIIDRYENKRDGRNVGELATFIIPPIVEYPPNFQAIEGREEEDNDDDAVEEKNEEESIEEERDTNEDYEIIDPTEFDGYPSNWDVGLKVGDTINLSRNPISSLHKLSEVTSFYRSKNNNSDDNNSRRREEAKKDVGINHDEDNNNDYNINNNAYVLNVNYAGNEMHQSVVRVVFVDGDHGFVKSLYELERKEGPVNLVSDLAVSEDNSQHVKFLIFHGYLQVVKK